MKRKTKKDFIENTMMGIEFLWGGPIKLETHEVAKQATSDKSYVNLWDPNYQTPELSEKEKFEWKTILYVIENRKLHKQEI